MFCTKYDFITCSSVYVSKKNTYTLNIKFMPPGKFVYCVLFIDRTTHTQGNTI